MMNYGANFKYLVRQWIDPDKPENPNSLTVDRQLQLIEILKSYRKNFGGDTIPIEHFTDRLVADSSYFPSRKEYKKNHLRNNEAFPVVYAYLCNVLEKRAAHLVLKKGIVIGEADIPRNGFIPDPIWD